MPPRSSAYPRPQRLPRHPISSLTVLFLFLLTLLLPFTTFALPSPPTDIPEEVLRTQIITDARSPIDGKPLSAAEYAQLQTDLAADPILRSTLDQRIRDTIFLLQIRRTIRAVFPFLLQ